MNKLLLSIAFIILTASYGFSQETQLTFTLEGAKEYALQNNKTIQNAKSDVQIADQQYKNALSSGLPQINATLDYMTNFNYEFDFAIGGTATTPSIDYSLLDAGDYEILNLLNPPAESSSGTSIVLEDQSNATIQVSQLIFSGQFWLGVKVAKISKQLAEKSITATELNVKQSVASSYYMILITDELINIINENQENLTEIIKHTSDMYKAGYAEQTDVDQIKINLSQLENSKRAMERNLQLNYNTLRFVMGIESNEELKLSDNLNMVLNSIESDSFLNTNFSISDNPSYQIMEVQEEIGEKNISMKKWMYAPTLTGFYSYKEKLMTSGFDLSPKNAAGLTLSMPIFGGGAKRAQLNMAKIELDKISTSKDLLEEQLHLQEKQLSFELNSAYENYMTQKKNVKVAQRVYESNNNKYKQGLISSLDLIQANTNYLQAESNYINAVLELLQSKLELDKISNNL